MLSTDPYPTADNTIIPIELFFAGDILLYAIALGKEESAGWWCTYYRLMKDEWQSHNHKKGVLWTTDDIAQHAEIIDGSTKPRDRKGVKTIPVFKSTLLTHYITPILHIMIGKGNNILEH
eukprot:8841588-Ditylum_brightwellii.AAC.1